MTLDKSNFPTIGSAVLYLNSFHQGKHLDRLNYLSRHQSWWITSAANNIWESRHEDIAKDYPDLLAFSIKELYVMTFNEQVDKQS